MYQALFFSLSSQGSNEAKKYNASSQVKFIREKEVNDAGTRFSKVPVSSFVFPLFALKIKA